MNEKVTVDGNTITITQEVTLGGSMMECEERIRDAVNDVGSIATEHALKQFDTDGTPLIVAGERWYSKGELPKKYETPYGTVRVERNVYQRSKGGATLCPMEDSARVVVTSTPQYARILTYKYARTSARTACEDLYETTGRKAVPSHMQTLAEFVGSVVQAKEETWEYELPEMDRPVTTIALGIDGTCMLQCDEGWREAMAGTLSLYDEKGERMHTIYVGAAPEHGKETFYARMTREIERLQQQYPDARYVAIADGAKVNWDFLGPHVSVQILDFYHATEYVNKASHVAWPDDEQMAQAWTADQCHQLKHEPGAATSLLEIMKLLAQKTLPVKIKESLQTSITYFSNHQHQMDYARYSDEGLPIGSGVTESACKILIKQRLCNAGMRWKSKGASVVLSLRSLVLSEARWEQFWNKISCNGVPVLA